MVAIANISNIFTYSDHAKAILNIYSNPTSYDNAFHDTARLPGSGITVNYASTTTNIDDIIATADNNSSNIIKGSQLD